MKKTSSNSSTIRTILELWKPLSVRRKRQFCLLGFLMLFGGLSEAISLGLVVPFLVALASPEKLLYHPYFGIGTTWLETAGTFLGIKLEIEQWANRYILLFLAAIFVIAALLAGGIRLILLWFSLRLSNAAGLDLGLEVYNRTLHQPFSVHIGQNSSKTVSFLTHKIPMFSLSLSSFLTLITSGIIALFLVVALMIVSPATTLAASLSLGICYFIISWINSKRLAINSQVASRKQDAVIKNIQEGLGGIRDIILDGTQKVFCDVYKNNEMTLRQASASTMFLSYSPRFFMESLGIVIFSILAFALTREQGGLTSALPILGALVLGVQRLLPTLQQGYQAWSTLLAYQQSNKEVISLLDKPISCRAHLPGPKPMLFKNEIQFKDVKFRYSPQASWVLDGLSFSIPKGARVGFVGKTGSGKSTCLDLLMGLLAPQEGLILIDGQPLASHNIRNWQCNIAHVPQAIYLADSTLAENIAFGTPLEKIDLERVRMVAQQAEISEFIEASPEGYSAMVGERGIRLSGGQRQRIGIARALYKQAQVLIFDESTSALDHETENAVIKAINSLNSGTTIIHITHRVTTLNYCEKIVNLDTNKQPHFTVNRKNFI